MLGFQRIQRFARERDALPCEVLRRLLQVSAEFPDADSDAQQTRLQPRAKIEQNPRQNLQIRGNGDKFAVRRGVVGRFATAVRVVAPGWPARAIAAVSRASVHVRANAYG